MKYFTQEEDIMFSEKLFKPRKHTLDFIRLVAHSYNNQLWH